MPLPGKAAAVTAMLDDLDQAVAQAPEPARGSLLAAFLPVLVAHEARGSASPDAAERLRPLFLCPDREVRLRAVAALRDVLLGTGQRGLMLLDGLNLDATPALRDYLPELRGACGAGGQADLVEDGLRESLRHASPGRRKSALRGIALAHEGTERDYLLHEILAALAHPTDFTLVVEGLHTIGAILARSLTLAAYELFEPLLLTRDFSRAVDAGWNPLTGLARAASGTELAEVVEREWIAPALTAPGASRRQARLRRVGAEAYVALYCEAGSEALDGLWEALDDPIRESRRAVLWELAELTPATPDDATRAALVEDLLERSRAGRLQASAAALCLGRLLEGRPDPGVSEAMLEWARHGGGELPTHALFGLARMHRGDRDPEERTELFGTLRAKGGPPPFVPLALGALHAGSGDSEAQEALAKATKSRRSPEARAEALAGWAMVHAGRGIAPFVHLAAASLPRFDAAPVLGGALLAGAGLSEETCAPYFRAYRQRLRESGLGQAY
jgi:hypothetical protein